jgi:hypothetical protein
MTTQTHSRRPEAPGAPLNGDAIRLNAMRLTRDAVESLSAELAMRPEAPSAAHLLELGAEIRKLAATMRRQ